MTARDLARFIAIAANVLLMASLCLMLVWWSTGVKLFAAAWLLYSLAWICERAVANQTFELAPASVSGEE